MVEENSEGQAESHGSRHGPANLTRTGHYCWFSTTWGTIIINIHLKSKHHPLAPKGISSRICVDLTHSSQHIKGTAIPCYDDVAPSFMHGASLERRKPCYLGTSKLIDHVLFSTRRSKDKTAQQTGYLIGICVYTACNSYSIYTVWGVGGISQ